MKSLDVPPCFLSERVPVKEFRCDEVESEKVGSPQELNPGHLWVELPVIRVKDFRVHKFSRLV